MKGLSVDRLRDDAQAIWRAAVEAVDSQRLVQNHVAVQDGRLTLGDLELNLDSIARIAIVGAGKAGAGMAAGAIAGLGESLCREKQVHGWLNVPDDCVRDLPFVHLHGARPAGVNEPTTRGVAGASEILRIVGQLDKDDLCLCLLSGGGSALLPAPIPSIPLAEKLELTRRLSGAGANIQQLNTVRKQLSRIKGGRLAQACRAGHLVVLVISDVMGDPLDIIASGPTIPDRSTAADALRVWKQLDLPADIAPEAYRYLGRVAEKEATRAGKPESQEATEVPRLFSQVHHHIIGNNAVAVAAACQEAKRRGYSTEAVVADASEGDANEIGHRLAQYALDWKHNHSAATPADESPETTKHCLVTGGEPTVRLAPAEKRGRGGRNQQLVLAAYDFLRQHVKEGTNPCSNLVLLSGGTDGEDGPTDAAGAWVDAEIAERLGAGQDDVTDALARNDAYTLFQRHGALLITGPTHTNVCDVRILLLGGTP